MIRISQQGIYRFTLFVAIALILVMTFFSFRKTKNLIEFSSSIEHFQEVQKTLEKMFSVLKDAETSQRGYILSEDSLQLKLFTESVNSIGLLKLKLDSLLSERVAQKNRLDNLSLLLDERINIMKDVLSHSYNPYSKDGKKTFIELFKQGFLKMNQIRYLIDQMQQQEEKNLSRYRSENNRLVNITPFFLFLLSSISIALIFISYLAMSRELLKRIEFEKELAKNIEELNRSNSDLEHFAYVASHDLQEPLRKIRSFGDRLALKHSSSLNEDARSMIDKIQNAAGRMQTLIDDLLSFSRLLNSGGETEKVDLNDILKEVLNDMEVNIHSKNAKIESDNLPEIDAVPSLIRQLFQNLISNSLKFSKAEVNPEIHISFTTIKGKDIPNIELVRKNNKFYKIEFEDNGIGFDEKYLDKIFIIFQRLHGKLDYGGTGIGLAVCKRIMSLHHGFITAKSKLGEGSTFILYFPIGREK
jgi:signal transduction histidine kinase